MLAHAAVGCFSGLASSGNCGAGAAAAALSEAAVQGNLIKPAALGKWGSFKGAAEAGLLGGVTAEITGGKFGDGFSIAAAGYLFNQSMHKGLLDRVREVAAQLGTDAATALGNDSNLATRVQYDPGAIVRIAGALERLATAQGEDFWTSDDMRPERQMLARVIAGSSDPYTLGWFMHEDKEATLLQSAGGLTDQQYLVAQQQAHSEALRIQGLTQQQLYAPSVVRQNSMLFGPSYPR